MSRIILAFFLLLLGFTTLEAYGQNDSLVFTNGKHMVGTIRDMERGTLSISTPYGRGAIRVRWERIAEIFSKVTMIISTTGGQRHYGTLTSDLPGFVTIDSKYEGLVRFSLDDIVYIKPIEKSFLDRLNASIDLGYTRTRAQNQRQFTVRSRVGFIAERYNIDVTYNSFDARRDVGDNISRTDANLTGIYVLKKDFFGVMRLDFLENTQQQLDLRSNVKLGLGKFIFRKNTMFWHVSTGLAHNNENLTGEESDRRSGEFWLGTEANLFNVGDLTLFTNSFAYQSLNSDRIRVDVRADLRYSLPLDFYIRTGITLNYDSQPAPNTTDLDYIWQTTFGWSW